MSDDSYAKSLKLFFLSNTCRWRPNQLLRPFTLSPNSDSGRGPEIFLAEIKILLHQIRIEAFFFLHYEMILKRYKRRNQPKFKYEYKAFVFHTEPVLAFVWWPLIFFSISSIPSECINTNATKDFFPPNIEDV